eukprot:58901-Chlamydomonas_euryale.AAC.4
MSRHPTPAPAPVVQVRLFVEARLGHHHCDVHAQPRRRKRAHRVAADATHIRHARRHKWQRHRLRVEAKVT